MHDCTKEEMALIQEFQDDMKVIKRRIRNGRAVMKKLSKMNEASGRVAEAAEINAVKAEGTATLAAADKWDAVAFAAAQNCYTDPGPIILGGGR